MNRSYRLVVLGAAVAVWMASGCAAPKVDFSSLERPGRAAELDAYNVFVGSWVWEAEVLNAEAGDKAWTGKAEWKWTLDKRCLHGMMSAKSASAEFEAAGIWSWHPRKKNYIWWMFNNWGYPQEGTATYDAESRCWKMTYESVGLDGTTSYGQYKMKVINNDTLDWRMDEWADMTHLMKKLEMTGRYKRAR